MDTLDPEQCAALLNVNRTTALALAGEGEIPGAMIGRAWVFLKSDVIAFLTKKVREQTAERRTRNGMIPDSASAKTVRDPRTRRNPIPCLP